MSADWLHQETPAKILSIIHFNIFRDLAYLFLLRCVLVLRSLLGTVQPLTMNQNQKFFVLSKYIKVNIRIIRKIVR